MQKLKSTSEHYILQSFNEVEAIFCCDILLTLSYRHNYMSVSLSQLRCQKVSDRVFNSINVF